MHRTLLAAAAALFTPLAAAAPQDIIDAAFGRMDEGATLTQVRNELERHADNDDAVSFAMGAVDFLLAGEGLTQAAHRHGFLGTVRQLAAMTGDTAGFLEWFANDNPDPTTAADFDKAAADFVAALATAEATLAGAKGDFKCVIDIPAIRFDINADGKTTPAESLGALFGFMPNRSRYDPDQERWVTGPMVPPDLTVAFDRGDAAWLRGYCHVLMGAGEWALAHDWQELFDHTAHVFFPKAEIPFGYLPGSTFTLEIFSGGAMQTPAPFDITDVLVFFGNMRLPVDEPDRMKAALAHFRAAVTLGKEMWTHYDAEADDDREWIPNPNQHAAFAEVEVDQDMHDAWLMFLDEADDLLAGEKVLRFWRGDGTRGIDMPKVFNEPQTFDLLYWIQGSAAAPYLREGEFTSPGTWAQLVNVFDNRVFRYSFWFN